MRNVWIPIITAAAVATLAACSESDQQQARDQANQAMDKAEKAADQVMDKADKAADKMDDMADDVMASGKSDTLTVASLSPAGDSGVQGQVTFSKAGDGLQVRSDVSGLSPGKHGVHIHSNGDCSNRARAAGPHLKLSTDGADDIQGNLGEFTAAESGADSERTLLRVPLSEIMGKAVVVHAKGNDPSQPPDGAAGERIACGVIEQAQASGADHAGDSSDSGDSADGADAMNPDSGEAAQ